MNTRPHGLIRRIAIAACRVTLFLAVLGSTALAAEPAGQLMLMQGKAKLRHDQRDSVMTAVGQSAPIYAGDHVQTAGDSQVQIVLGGGAQAVTVYAGSVFRILTDEAHGTALGLIIGKAAFSVATDAADARLNLRTPTATIAAARTRFVAAHGATQTALLTQEGAVELSSRAYPSVMVRVPEGYASRVVAQQTPSVPISAPREVLQRVLRENGQEALQTLRFGDPVAVPERGKAGGANAAIEGVPPGPPTSLPPTGGSTGGGPPGGSPPGGGPPGGGPPGGGPPGGGPPGGGPPGGSPPGGGPPGGAPPGGPPGGPPALGPPTGGDPGQRAPNAGAPKGERRIAPARRSLR